MAKLNGSKWIRRNKRLAIYRRDNHRCVYCHRDLATGRPTLDHVLARELGGSNCESNLVTACLSCNSAKRDLPLEAFLSILADRGVSARQVRARIRKQARQPLVKWPSRAGTRT